jgi:hypothetical protein
MFKLTTSGWSRWRWWPVPATRHPACRGEPSQPRLLVSQMRSNSRWVDAGRPGGGWLGAHMTAKGRCPSPPGVSRLVALDGMKAISPSSALAARADPGGLRTSQLTLAA